MEIYQRIKKDQYDQYDSSTPIELDTWFDYFNALYNRNSMPTGQFQLPNINSLIKPELHSYLNKIITIKEVISAITNLKSGKAPGQDRIMNEMLKVGKTTLSHSLCKIFNLVLVSEKYPYSWCKNFLVPCVQKWNS